MDKIKRILLIDNYDSFTYNIVQYLKILGCELDVILNDAVDVDEIDFNYFTHIIISPGPKKPRDAGISMEVIKNTIGVVPIFGICLGYQCLNEYFGGNLVKGNPVHGIVDKIYNDGGGIYSGLPKEFNITRYHSLNIDVKNISKELLIDGRLKDGTVMSFRNKDLKIYGVQYHPEAILSEFGISIFKNFLERK